MSPMRKAAGGLVEHRRESFVSRHPIGESQARLSAALAKAGIKGAARFTSEWRTEGERAVLEARFDPSPGTQRFLQASSIGMALLVAASVWAVAAEGVGRPMAFLLSMFTVLAVLALPFVALGLASQRDAEEARIRKAIRVALQDEAEKFPPPQRWADED